MHMDVASTSSYTEQMDPDLRSSKHEHSDHPFLKSHAVGRNRQSLDPVGQHAADPGRDHSCRGM